MGASPTLLPVTSMARTSSVSSSIPRWILRQRRRLGPPYLRAFHSPSPSAFSPSALIPVLSIRRCRGPFEAAKRDIHGQSFLATAQSAVVRAPTSRARSGPADFQRTRSFDAGPSRTRLSSQGRFAPPRRCSSSVDHAYQSVWLPSSRQDSDQIVRDPRFFSAWL